MQHRDIFCSKSGFEAVSLSGGICKMNAERKHTRLALRDDQGRPREVLLCPPDQLDKLGGSFTPDYGLKKDLEQALKKYSPIEQRIIFRVLVQGLTFNEATKNMRHSPERWRKWFVTKALPQLREDLKEYFDDIHPARRTSRPYINPPILSQEVDKTIKCRYCSFTHIGNNQKNLSILRNHVKEKHAFVFEKIQQKLLESNY